MVGQDIRWSSAQESPAKRNVLQIFFCNGRARVEKKKAQYTYSKDGRSYNISSQLPVTARGVGWRRALQTCAHNNTPTAIGLQGIGPQAEREIRGATRLCSLTSKAARV
jgi:hypothetical protein